MWLVALTITIFVSHIVTPPVMKQIGRLPQRSKSIWWQYFFSFLLVIIVFPWIGEWHFSSQVVFVGIIGILNVVAVYSQWAAASISQSKTYSMTVLDDVIALGLGIAFLDDVNSLSPYVTLGVALAFIGPAFMWRSSHLEEERTKYLLLLKHVLIMSIIWGGAVFAMRYFAIEKNLLIGNFLVGWYGGSLLGASIGRIVIRSKELKEGDCSTVDCSTMRRVLSGLVLAVLITIALGTRYWTLSLVPLTVVIPILLVCESVFPVITGWIFFKEHSQLRKRDIVGIFTSITAAIIIAWNYKTLH